MVTGGPLASQRSGTCGQVFAGKPQRDPEVVVWASAFLEAWGTEGYLGYWGTWRPGVPRPEDHMGPGVPRPEDHPFTGT